MRLGVGKHREGEERETRRERSGGREGPCYLPLHRSGRTATTQLETEQEPEIAKVPGKIDPSRLGGAESRVHGRQEGPTPSRRDL